MQAIILAAGNNIRFDSRNTEKPFFKQSLEIAGRSITERLVLQLSTLGCSRVTFVCGKNLNYLQNKLNPLLNQLGLDGEFIYNNRPDRGNGYSLGLALKTAETKFYLSMSDHVYSDTFMDAVSKVEPINSGLFVDYKIQEVFDLADATKVLTHEGKVLKLSKELSSYNAIDTGFFILRKNIQDGYQKLTESSLSLSLSYMMIEHAKSHAFYAFDIADGNWQDIDDEAMYEAAMHKFGQ